jgi:hypothetical protein
VTGAALVLETGGVSRIAGALRMDRVQVVASGASVLTLSGAAGHLELRASGTARLRLPGLVVRDLDAVLSGAGRVTVGVSDTLAARTSGASTLSYRGAPRITRQQISGVSSITADSPDGGGSFSGNRCAP